MADFEMESGMPERTERQLMSIPGYIYKDIMERLFNIVCLERGAEDRDSRIDLQNEINELLIDAMRPFFARVNQWCESEFDSALLSMMCGMTGFGNGLIKIDEARFYMDLDDMDFLEEDIDHGEQQVERQEG